MNDKKKPSTNQLNIGDTSDFIKGVEGISEPDNRGYLYFKDLHIYQLISEGVGPGSVKIKNNVRMGLISNKTEEYFKNFNLRYNEDTIRGVGIYLMVLEGKSYYYNMHVRFVTRSSGYLDRLIFGSKI